MLAINVASLVISSECNLSTLTKYHRQNPLAAMFFDWQFENSYFVFIEK